MMWLGLGVRSFTGKSTEAGSVRSLAQLGWTIRDGCTGKQWEVSQVHATDGLKDQNKEFAS